MHVQDLLLMLLHHPHLHKRYVKCAACLVVPDRERKNKVLKVLFYVIKWNTSILVSANLYDYQKF
ncbi:hypothetical protein SAMN05216311_11653 [Chitinophaga sp. CF418]|nr:hypothetical protein SAMN05216311_11653 [Chitinophaga sp. CF418]